MSRTFYVNDEDQLISRVYDPELGITVDSVVVFK